MGTRATDEQPEPQKTQKGHKKMAWLVICYWGAWLYVSFINRKNTKELALSGRRKGQLVEC